MDKEATELLGAWKAMPKIFRQIACVGAVSVSAAFVIAVAVFSESPSIWWIAPFATVLIGGGIYVGLMKMACSTLKYEKWTEDRAANRKIVRKFLFKSLRAGVAAIFLEWLWLWVIGLVI